MLSLPHSALANVSRLPTPSDAPFPSPCISSFFGPWSAFRVWCTQYPRAAILATCPQSIPVELRTTLFFCVGFGLEGTGLSAATKWEWHLKPQNVRCCPQQFVRRGGLGILCRRCVKLNNLGFRQLNKQPRECTQTWGNYVSCPPALEFSRTSMPQPWLNRGAQPLIEASAGPGIVIRNNRARKVKS